MTLAKIAKTILKKKPKSVKPISENKKKANELLREADRIMGQAMKPEMRRAKKEKVEALRAKANKLLMNEKAAGGIIKKGAKAVVKRGRKSKRGRPKTKKEVVKKITKKQDPSKIKKLPGESDADFKKRKALINKLKTQSMKETAKDTGTKLPSTKDRTSKSMTIPLKRKEQSKASFRRRVMQGLQGVTKKGESKDIGKAGYPVSETMRELGYTGSRKGGIDLTDKELEALGFQIAKAGGSLIKAKNGSGKDFLVPEKIRKNIPYYLNKLKKKKKLPKKLSVTVAKNGGELEKKKKITFKKIKKATKDVIKDKISGAKENIKDIFKGTSLTPYNKKYYKAGGRIKKYKTGGNIQKRAGGGIALRGFGATRRK